MNPVIPIGTTKGPGETPHEYIFITPDLESANAVIPPDEASDHLAVGVTVK